jgi:hypothetical protein
MIVMTLLRVGAVIGLLEPGAVGTANLRDFGKYTKTQRHTWIFTHPRRGTRVIIYGLEMYKEQNNF